MNGEPRVVLDMESKLQITLHNRDPVALTDLVQSLMAVSAQFERFIKSNSKPSPEACTELLIHEVRQGSIVVELVAHSLPMVPLIWGDGAIHEWVNYAKSIMLWLAGKEDKPCQKITKTDLDNFSSMVQPVARDDGSQVVFAATSGGSITNHFHIGHSEARSVQEKVAREIDKTSDPIDNTHFKQYMTWHQIRFDSSLTSGSQAIIENISKAPKRVVFEDEETKRAMTKGDSRFARDWQELAYLVDVEVQSVNGTPRAYKIIRYYPEETFDPYEDE
ncbi:hypothetical protein [Terasakiella pusilla]|uniref:hypothetical protein n=1 Tax=Terasakiella pusilla TaxID=64973 RepID=UPI003AA7DF04